jgi:hypothetical protein
VSESITPSGSVGKSFSLRDLCVLCVSAVEFQERAHRRDAEYAKEAHSLFPKDSSGQPACGSVDARDRSHSPQMNQTNHFFNMGYGWLCKHCSAEDAERKQQDRLNPGQLSKTGMEGRGPKVPTLALAKWSNEDRHDLTCPRCGIEEQLTR